MPTLMLPRRDFLKLMGAGAAAAAAPRSLVAGTAGPERLRSNVLWISAEDISPTLGCYGDRYATTPNLDKFAAQGVRYENAFTHAPVCAPARSGLITGMYPTTIGTTWMRCRGVPPPEARCFPEYLRAAGYFCTNNSKTDYQFAAPRSAWDINGRSGHWRKRPDKSQPFFAVFNLGVTHESSTRRWTPGKQTHDPAKAPLPPYYPDTPTVRQNIACYYDKMSQLDGQVQRILDELADDGLADDTIVWFWGDHGWGLTRGKRWIYDSGIRVPLIVRVPTKLRKWAGAGDPKSVAPGTVAAEFARFIDFAPTMLSLAGVPVPKQMQGRAFLGPQKGPEPYYIYAARDRMDETYDCIRCLRDKRFKLIRNFMPYVTRGQHINYMDRTPILQEMRRLHAAGKLKPGAQMQFFEPTKPVHELYDVTADPYEVHNLAAQPKYKDVVQRMEKALFAKMKEIGDVGLIPEPDFEEMKGGGRAAPPAFHPSKPASQGAAVTVKITCPTRGASVIYQVDRASTSGGGHDDKAIFLTAAKAKVHGKGAHKGAGEITRWRGKDTYVSWEVRIPQAGKVPVHVCQANAGAGGSEFLLTVGEASLKGTVRHTRSWDDYVYVKVGEIDVPKPGKYTVTVKPVKQVQGRLGNLRSVVLFGGKDLARRRPRGARWLICSEPVRIEPGQAIRAQAWRLGYQPSGTVTYRYGDKPAPPAKADDTGPLWREKLSKSGVIDRILAVKAYDGRYAEGMDFFLKALSDEAGAVRYWAVVGLDQGCRDKPSIAKAKAAVEPLLKDPSPSVPVAAAQALVDWGDADKGLARLVELLRSSNDKTRQFAATALEKLGEKARPALAGMEAALRAQKRYSGAVLKRAVAALKKRG